MLLQPVILSSESGTRLWPLSLEKRPKQLLAFIGEEPMLWAAAARISDFNPAMFAPCNDAISQAKADFYFVCGDKESFLCSQADSIDYAVMKKSTNTPELGTPGCVAPFDNIFTDDKLPVLLNFNQRSHINSKKSANNTRFSLFFNRKIYPFYTLV
jgi:hypothetical protein